MLLNFIKALYRQNHSWLNCTWQLSAPVSYTSITVVNPVLTTQLDKGRSSTELAQPISHCYRNSRSAPSFSQEFNCAQFAEETDWSNSWHQVLESAWFRNPFHLSGDTAKVKIYSVPHLTEEHRFLQHLTKTMDKGQLTSILQNQILNSSACQLTKPQLPVMSTQINADR